MSNLFIQDLSRTEELDGRAMQAVRGGCYGGWKMPSCFPMPAYSAPSTTTTTISVAQANNQSQHNDTGNGSAVFGGGIYACNNQQGFNSIGGYAPALPVFA